jgi:hypothetical protein
MTYAWFATAGEWSSGETGGPKDAFGNVPTLDTKWTAPDLAESADVNLWVVMRDERGGVAWYEMCAHVE